MANKRMAPPFTQLDFTRGVYGAADGQTWAYSRCSKCGVMFGHKGADYSGEFVCLSCNTDDHGVPDWMVYDDDQFDHIVTIRERRREMTFAHRHGVWWRLDRDERGFLQPAYSFDRTSQRSRQLDKRVGINQPTPESKLQKIGSWKPPEVLEAERIRKGEPAVFDGCACYTESNHKIMSMKDMIAWDVCVEHGTVCGVCGETHPAPNDEN